MEKIWKNHNIKIFIKIFNLSNWNFLKLEILIKKFKTFEDLKKVGEIITKIFIKYQMLVLKKAKKNFIDLYEKNWENHSKKICTMF